MIRGWLQLPLALLAAAGLGIAAPASAPPSGQAWSADPESQYLLDLQIRQRALGDGVRAYPVPEGTCVVLGDLVTALDLPIKVDLAARRAEGWAFKEVNRLQIDRAAGKVSFGAKRSEPIAPSAIRDAPEGWCVETAALSRWLGLAVQPRTDASLLLLNSEDKLPVELAAERRERAARLTKASLPLTRLPRVTLPYRLWRTPSVDVMMDAGVTYSAGSGARIDHRASILAAGEALQMSYEARASTNRRGLPTGLRLRAYRSDPDGGLLGPLNATHAAMGDVEGIGSAVAGSSATGRGAMVTNRPLFQSVAFDRTQFSGELPPGWDAELYRNGELIAFAGLRPTASIASATSRSAMATIVSRSSPTVRRDRSRGALRASPLDKARCLPARPIIGREWSIPAATCWSVGAGRLHPAAISAGGLRQALNMVWTGAPRWGRWSRP